jgi:hypothetical protein
VRQKEKAKEEKQLEIERQSRLKAVLRTARR